MTSIVRKTFAGRIWLCLGVGLVLMLIALGYYVAGPRYSGVTAEKWLEEACRRTSTRFGPTGILVGVRAGAAQEALALAGPVEAFRHMGRRGIDCLIDAYVDQESAFRAWYERLAGKVRGFVRLPARSSPDLRVRSRAAYRLILRVGPSAIPAVVRRTQAADTEERLRLLPLLGEFGPGHAQTQACLFRMLADPSPEVVFRALEALWMTQPEPTSAIPQVLPFLNHANPRVREEASYVLGSLALIPPSLWQPLVKALSDGDGTVRANAARALGLSGASAQELSSALAGLLQDANPVTRFRAAEAMLRLQGPDSLQQAPHLSRVIREAGLSSNDYFWLIGFNGRTALGEEGVSAPETIAMFRRLLHNPQAYFRTDALAGLMFRLERSASGIPAELETLLRAAEHDHNGLVRFRARAILERWGNPEQSLHPGIPLGIAQLRIRHASHWLVSPVLGRLGDFEFYCIKHWIAPS